MATRSRIAIENQDGSVTSVYCHFDGHIHTNGVILNQHYRTKDKVEALIALGDLSALHRTIDLTIAYARDRGEDLVQSKYNRVEALFDMGFSSGIEYIYCFTKDGFWLVNELGSTNVAILSEVIEEEGLQILFRIFHSNKKDMTKKEKQSLADMLKVIITDTDKMFNTKSEPEAYIIGYLQGAVKTAISELEDKKQ